MLPTCFLPFFVKKNELVRIGPNEDGGYIVHKSILKFTDLIISCGLNDDWRFEKDFQIKNKRCTVVGYDHTVNFKFWVIYSIKSFYHLLIFKKLRLSKVLDFLKFFEYRKFFSHPNHHFKIKIGTKNNNREITISSILEKYKNYKKIILKIDIEGDEYRILNDIKKNEKLINCLLIEFHNVNKKFKTIENFIKRNNFLKLIHIHGNNYGQFVNNMPESLEMTFVNKNFVNISKKLTNNKYPIKFLDYPNLKRREDLSLKFDEK
jgi:hypothetical protein